MYMYTYICSCTGIDVHTYTHTHTHTHQVPWATMEKPGSQRQAESEHTKENLCSKVKETYYISLCSKVKETYNRLRQNRNIL
jgi:hypothetical protein